MAKFRSAIDAVVSGNSNQKLDFIVKSIVDNPIINLQPYQAIGVFAAVFLALFIGVIVATLGNNPPESYLVLTDAARNARNEALLERKWTWGYFVISIIASTISGLASRYIFAAIFGLKL